jgi:acetyl-CoA carboxylase biotin carboxyl carrier protein
MDENNDIVTQIGKIVEIAKRNKISDFSLETKDMKLTFKFAEEIKQLSEQEHDLNQTFAEPIQTGVNLEPQHFIIRSPLVGVFYRTASPSSPPFVEVGDIVEKGQTVCIIEAMKVMNEIMADRKGRVVKVFPENGEVVEFDAPLFELEAVDDEI